MKTIKWHRACALEDIDEDDVIRVDFHNQTFAVYRTKNNQFYATEGLCTHEGVHLSKGLLIGNIIECPMHQGRFDIRNGAAKGAPVCIDLKTYQVKHKGENLYIALPE
ncbi:MAG: Rieske 2Fe-2S domain-containing protein [Arenicella sp.]